MATKDPGKAPRKITNIFTLISGAIWGAVPRSIEYSKPEARFRRVDRAPRQQNNTKTDPNDHLVTKEAKWSKTTLETRWNHAWSNGQHVCPNIWPPSIPIPADFAICIDSWPLLAPPVFSQLLASPVFVTTANLGGTPFPNPPSMQKQVPDPKSRGRAIAEFYIILCKNNYPPPPQSGSDTRNML